MVKTAANTFAAYDQTHSVHREFLSHKNHVDRIYYNYAQKAVSEPAPSERQVRGSATATVSVVHDVQPPAKVIPVTAAVMTPDMIDDRFLTATDVLVALLAYKLGISFDELKMTESIRSLSGGRSTMQNEVIGDFAVEFGEMPGGAEDLPISALGAALTPKFSGVPGKQMNSVIARLISSKMPGGFNLSAMKTHLELHWRLPEQRRVTVICFASTMEPATRIGEEKTAKEWLDSVMAKYCAYSSLDILPGQALAANAAVPANATIVDAKGLELAKEEQRKILHAHFKVLKRHLQGDEHVHNEKMSELLTSLRDSEDKLYQWGVEFDDDFFNGIKPIFDAQKARFYDSWWNWAREDVIALLHHIQTGTLDATSAKTATMLSTIRNRLDPSSEEVLRYQAHFLARAGFNDLLRRDSLPNGVARPRFSYQLPNLGPKTEVSEDGEIIYQEISRSKCDGSWAGTYSQLIRRGSRRIQPSFIHLRTRREGVWMLDEEYTANYLDVLDLGMTEGFTFKDKTVLVTGAGPNSIGADIVKGLLTGGARVVVTTSRAPSASATFYQEMYRECAGPGASLKVLPFNAGSRSDCDALIDYIYRPDSAIVDLDFIVPFAAIPEQGQMDSLSSKSEVAHRAMLTNVLRLLGDVKKAKAERRYLTRPTNVLLPLSPNHGTFGGDGLYGESKLGLETLFNRGQSENWNGLVTITGVIIGWTRGTGLMSANNVTASAIERQGVLTFTQSEMAFNILALMSEEITALSEDGPIYADLSGGLHVIHDLKEVLSKARNDIYEESRLRKAVILENERQRSLVSGPVLSPTETNPCVRSRARLKLDFPSLVSHKQATENIAHLEGMHDLERVIVVVGYSELGPWGSSRTRWDIEKSAKLTQSSLIEMAWMMGLVKYHRGELKGETYAGWIDAETENDVHEDEFRTRYEEKILAHSGLRFIEPEGLKGYDPFKKEMLHEVVLEDDLPPFEASKTTAKAFIRRHGNLCHLESIADSDDYKVYLKKGAAFWVPKAIPADRFVAGQLPKGWDPLRYGIPPEIISQVDPIVIYALCCLSEAVLMAGLQDPHELYKHIHVSELANCLGTGAGPLLAMRGMYRDRYLDRSVQSDILQESYLNAIGAWSNMLLLASSGPIRTPTGTCATAIESLDSGCEAIKAGKVKVAIVGGSDDFEEEMSYEFGNMKATANTTDELKRGRLPSEMSRPTTSSRAGFVESAGCGVQIIMTADLALKMGLPVYAIVGYTHMAGDRVGRSVPAPGQGVLTAAKETAAASQSPLLDLEYRREMLQHQLSSIMALQKMQSKLVRSRNGGPDQLRAVENTALAAAKDARYIWSNDIRRQDPQISPIRASLAAWGLTIDDISVASFHGTSTVANEKNESDVVNTQMRHMDRSRGNPLLVVAQKYLTGHTKGAAGALMLNGGLQILASGMVPGNRNADNIDDSLRKFEHLVFPSKTIQTAGVKSLMLTSFGFGQKGGLVVLIHPRYLFAAVSEQIYDQYRKEVAHRQMRANALFARGLRQNNLFRAKDKSPWEAAGEQKVFLDPTARIWGQTLSELSFNPKNLHPRNPTSDMSLNAPVMKSDTAQIDPLSLFESFIRETGSDQDTSGVGVDIQETSTMPLHNANFIERNFTQKEQAYCQQASDPHASFAGRWVAKEAIFKSIGTRSQGAGASMDEIEVLPDLEGVPRVTVSPTQPSPIPSYPSKTCALSNR